MENRHIQRILVAVTILLAAVFVWLLAGQLQQDQRQAQHMEKLKQEAAPYEQEIQDIETQLHEMKTAIEENHITPVISLCFQVREVSDLQWVQDQFSRFGWPVAIVCSLEDPNAPQIVSWMAQSELDTELMFSGVSAYTQAQATLQQLKQQAEKGGVPVSSLWFLNEEEFTTENLDLLQQHGEKGFTQLTSYSLSIGSGTTKDDLLYVEHVPVQAGENKVFRSVELAARQEKHLILSFDVSQIRETENSQVFLDETSDALTQFEQDGKILVGTTNQFFQLTQQQEQSRQEKQAAYDKYAAEQTEHLEELREKVNSIYKNWSQEE